MIHTYLRTKLVFTDESGRVALHEDELEWDCAACLPMVGDVVELHFSGQSGRGMTVKRRVFSYMPPLQGSVGGIWLQVNLQCAEV